MNRPDLIPQHGEGSLRGAGVGCAVAIAIFVALFIVVGISVYLDPPPTKEEIEASRKRVIDNYMEWCKSLNGEVTLNEYKRPQSCHTRKD